ncbi:MAG: DUF7079 family protein [Pyrinomonadaceae bacterium]
MAVGIIAASPYSLEEIESILVDEVYPICKYNLLNVAGEWQVRSGVVGEANTPSPQVTVSSTSCTQSWAADSSTVL